MKRIVTLALAILMVMSCLLLTSCTSVEDLIAEGNYYEAYQMAVEEGNKELQKEILWKSAVTAAISRYESDSRFRYMGFVPDKIENVYYYSYKDAQGKVYEEVLICVVGKKEGNPTTLYYTNVGDKYNNFAWQRDLDVRSGYDDIEYAYKETSTVIDIKYIMKNGMALSQTQIEECQNKLWGNLYASVVDEEASFIEKAEYNELTVEDALQGTWTYTYSSGLVKLSYTFENGSYQAKLIDKNNEELFDSVQGTYVIEDNSQILLTTNQGEGDGALRYKLHKNELVLLQLNDYAYWETLVREE